MTPPDQPSSVRVDLADVPAVLFAREIGLTPQRLRELIAWEDAYDTRPARERAGLDG